MYFIDNSAKTNWKFIGLVAVVAIAIGAGILIFSMQKEAPSQFLAITEPEAKPSEELAEELPTLETADWKTYRNEEFGFEFRYPSRTGGVLWRVKRFVCTLDPSLDFLLFLTVIHLRRT